MRPGKPTCLPTRHLVSFHFHTNVNVTECWPQLVTAPPCHPSIHYAPSHICELWIKFEFYESNFTCENKLNLTSLVWNSIFDGTYCIMWQRRRILVCMLIWYVNTLDAGDVCWRRNTANWWSRLITRQCQHSRVNTSMLLGPCGLILAFRNATTVGANTN